MPAIVACIEIVPFEGRRRVGVVARHAYAATATPLISKASSGAHEGPFPLVNRTRVFREPHEAGSLQVAPVCFGRRVAFCVTGR